MALALTILEETPTTQAAISMASMVGALLPRTRTPTRRPSRTPDRAPDRTHLATVQPLAHRREGQPVGGDELQELLLAATESADGLAWLTAHATAHGLLSSDEERALALTLRSRRATLEQRAEARERMILANLRLVMRLAGGMQRYSGDLELIDLICEGIVGLMRAVDRFDPALGYRFSTYGTWWIAQALQRAVAQNGHAIRLPVYLYERRKRLIRTRTLLMEELKREPRLDELVARCRAREADRELDETQAALLLVCQETVASLNATVAWARRDGEPSQGREEDMTLAGSTPEPKSAEWFERAEQSEDARWLLSIAAYALGVRCDAGDLQARMAQTRVAQARMERLGSQSLAAHEALTRHQAEQPDATSPASHAQRHAAHGRRLLRETQRLGRELQKTRAEIAGIRAFDVWATRALASESVSLDVIGKRYGITRERVRQIESKANEQVKQALAEVGVTSAASYRGAE